MRALEEAGRGDLHDGPNARAVRALALLAHGLALGTAAPGLRTVADRGALGGHDGGIEPDVETTVLVALAGLQKPQELWSAWHHLWRRGPARLWPVAVTGMRRSLPEGALAFLPEIVKRAEGREGFPLGQLLWGFGKDRGSNAE